MTSNSEVLKRQLRAFWDAQEIYWDILAAETSVTSPNRYRAASFIPEGNLILDLACGNAANSIALRGRGIYVGTDVSLGGLQKAVQRSLRLVCGDADHLPYHDAVFDAAMATFVLEHAANPVQMLREMHRVVRPGGRIVLLGPAWDFPFWYSSALRSKAKNRRWLLSYTLRRFRDQLLGWWFGRLPFLTVDDPDAFHTEFVPDSDAVYIVWTYEVVRLMKRWSCRLVHWEVDDPMLGTNVALRWLKRSLTLLPPYRYAGSTVLLVFER